MISREKLDFAVSQVVDVCLHAEKGEKTCVITDLKTKHIGVAIADKLKQAAGNAKLFVMEDFGKRPEDGSSPLKFPEEIKTFMEGANVSVYAAEGKKGELQTFRSPMLKIITSNKSIRHGHMIGINDLIMEMGMSADYNLVKKVSKQVYDIVSKAKQIRVTTSKGTDLIVDFNANWRWKNSDGDVSKPGAWNNLPDGEVFTCPKSVNGRAIIDGVLGDYMSEKFGLIDKTPVTLEIKNGFVASVACSNKIIENEISNYIKKVENADRFGEFAIGTNVGLKTLIGNLLQDEKFPGVHIAVGHSYPEDTKADWDADVHLDMIIQKTTIEVDGIHIMKNGVFSL